MGQIVMYKLYDYNIIYMYTPNVKLQTTSLSQKMSKKIAHFIYLGTDIFCSIQVLGNRTFLVKHL